MILSSDPALTAPVVRAGESVRDAFIILKGHLLVTATTTRTINTTNTSASSDNVGAGAGMGVVADVAENKRLSDDPSAMIPTSNDDEMEYEASHDNHVSTSASFHTGR